jgi:hypothetical protein
MSERERGSTSPCHWRQVAVPVLCSVLLAIPGRAQQQDELAALRDRVDLASLSALRAMIDSAKAAELPVIALISKMQEGAMRNAEAPVIVAAARALLGRLRQSRDALGSAAVPAELEAAAGALKAGALPTQLSELRAARDGRSIEVPLIVLTDLLARGTPRDSAATALQTMIGANATDAAFATFRQSIAGDIKSGITPAAAVRMRARNVVERQP